VMCHQLPCRGFRAGAASIPLHQAGCWTGLPFFIQCSEYTTADFTCPLAPSAFDACSFWHRYLGPCSLPGT